MLLQKLQSLNILSYQEGSTKRELSKFVIYDTQTQSIVAQTIHNISFSPYQDAESVHLMDLPRKAKVDLSTPLGFYTIGTNNVKQKIIDIYVDKDMLDTQTVIEKVSENEFSKSFRSIITFSITATLIGKEYGEKDFAELKMRRFFIHKNSWVETTERGKVLVELHKILKEEKISITDGDLKQLMRRFVLSDRQTARIFDVTEVEKTSTRSMEIKNVSRV